MIKIYVIQYMKIYKLIKLNVVFNKNTFYLDIVCIMCLYQPVGGQQFLQMIVYLHFYQLSICFCLLYSFFILSFFSLPSKKQSLYKKSA